MALMEAVVFPLTGLAFEFGRWLLPAAGLAQGLALGLVQSLLLRPGLPWLRSRRWTGLTAGVVVISWSVGGLLVDIGARFRAEFDPWIHLALGAGLGLGFGLLLGTVQWLELRRAASGAGPWIGYTASAWTLALIPAFAGAASLPRGAPRDGGLVVMVASGALMGLLLGMVGGIGLAHLRPRSGPEVDHRQA